MACIRSLEVPPYYNISTVLQYMPDAFLRVRFPVALTSSSLLISLCSYSLPLPLSYHACHFCLSLALHIHPFLKTLNPCSFNGIFSLLPSFHYHSSLSVFHCSILILFHFLLICISLTFYQNVNLSIFYFLQSRFTFLIHFIDSIFLVFFTC